jgi:hypothetical protein
MTTKTLTYGGTLIATSCWCGIGVGIPSSLYNEARRSGANVYCPIGHSFVWSETENDRLKRDLKWANDRAAAERARADQAEASRWAMKGVATKLRQRTLEGTCPFCGQHLRDLERHIGRQHPDEQADQPDVPA